MPFIGNASLIYHSNSQIASNSDYFVPVQSKSGSVFACHSHNGIGNLF